MSLWQLVLRGLVHFRGTTLAVLIAVAVACAVLTGALVVGDSMQYTLYHTLEMRLGHTDLMVVGGERFFTAHLADSLALEIKAAVAPVIQLRGMVSDSEGSHRAVGVQILGVDDRFYSLGPGASAWPDINKGGVVLNEPLARRLHVQSGDTVVCRMDTPRSLSRDLVLSPASRPALAARLTVVAIAGEGQFGRFDTAANHVAPYSAFVPLGWLQDQLDREDQANILLIGPGSDPNLVNAAMQRVWQLADAGLTIQSIPQGDMLELRSTRVFLDPAVGHAVLSGDTRGIGVLSYFVNHIRACDRSTPYSMVTAAERKGPYESLLPEDMTDDQIVINEWLAHDLQARVGDALELAYYVPEDQQLVERTASFTVCAVVPMSSPGLDPYLMPDFPGLVHAANCRDWDPGLPVDLERIRDKDEAYWQQYRGTPKAFVTLADGQAMWANRYGELTAVRFPMHAMSPDRLDRFIRARVAPTAMGLFAVPVRTQGERAGASGTDFGQLFLGLSMFLIGAGLLLIRLLFVFGIENRSCQTGTLLALGWTPGLVRRLFLWEGVVVAGLGACLGAMLGLLYTWALIHALSTIWQGAVGDTQILFHARPLSVCMGAGAGFMCAMAAIVLSTVRQLRHTAHQLLSGTDQGGTGTHLSRKALAVGLPVSLAAMVFAFILIADVGTGDSEAVTGAFFGAGALLLVTVLIISRLGLAALGARSSAGTLSLNGLAIRNTSRRAGRSQAVIGLLACGVFLVVAVGVNQKAAPEDPGDRQSGTGGFFFYAESSVPIAQDLSTVSGRRALGVLDIVPDTMDIVPLRVHDGDDASCLNLNRAQHPRLLGVQSQQLAGRFTFKQYMESLAGKSPWELLDMDLGPDVVPAIGDYATVFWGLGKTIGDYMTYTDQTGRPIRLRFVALLDSSMLQGSLFISEDQFIKRFPADPGYRSFLLDVPAGKAEVVATGLSRQWQDYGFSLEKSTERLAAFAQVENTYLSIFLVLGGLGLILGSVGLGLVVMRNLLERRGELAMLRALGFRRRTLVRLVFLEHWGLLLAGVISGVVCALIAIGPALHGRSGRLPVLSMGAMVAALVICGGVWIGIATRMCLKGTVLEGLRHE